MRQCADVQIPGSLRLIVMKVFVSILLLVGICGCRTISGTYYESFGTGWGGADYHFRKDGTFEYKSHYDVGGEYGSGKYKIRAGRLILTFTDSPVESYVSASYVYHERSSLDSMRSFVVTVVDENREPLPFGNLHYSTDEDTSTVRCVWDFNGMKMLHLTASVDTLYLKIQYVGYGVIEKSIDVSRYDSIKVQLLPDPNHGMTPVDSGSVRKYGYKKVDSKQIILTERRIDEVLTDHYRIKRTRRKLIKHLVKQ